jgi:hypothetical protein
VTKLGAGVTWYRGTRMSTSLAGTDVNDYNVSGVTLVDPVNAKRYLVATSGGGNCVCSTAGTNSMHEGDADSFYATFTAPPPEVTKVNVELRALGTFSDVPIS